MRRFIYNNDKDAIIDVEKIVSVRIHRCANIIFQIEANLINKEVYILDKLDNIQEAKQALANWEDRLVFYYAKKK